MATARRLRVFAITAVATSGLIGAGGASAAAKPFIDHFRTIRTIASAVPKRGPGKGDVNPYGVAVVPRSTGKLARGGVLVSNFNDARNDQGTGSTIVEVSPSGKARVFAGTNVLNGTVAAGDSGSGPAANSLQTLRR